MNYLLPVGFSIITTPPAEFAFKMSRCRTGRPGSDMILLSHGLNSKKRNGDGELGSASHKIKQLQGLKASSGDKSELLTK